MKKEEFKQKTHQVIDELAETISNLESRAGQIAEDAKEEYKEQLDKLRELRDSLSAKLEEYDKMTDGKWDLVKESAGNFFASVAEAWKENFGKVSDAFKKEPPRES
ncbi:MAG: hypothetical protein PHY68_00830 [Proteiniphilum sp.]|jgi:uncharacterized protein YoxC|nr:hypothetical protein [Proteiniphilum sp.]MDD5618979.1 hypothetical protein [Proteiniphilum sp.]